MNDDLLNLLRHSDAPIVVHGAGAVAEVILIILDHMGVSVACVCDRNPQKEGVLFQGRMISSPEAVARYSDPIILVTVMQNVTAVMDTYRNQGYKKVYSVETVLSEFQCGNEAGSRERYLQYCCRVYRNNIITERGNGLDIRYLALSLTERCNLQCRDCANLMPLFPHPTHYPLEHILKSLERITGCVDSITTLALIGGEPFLYPYLKNVLEAASVNPCIKSILVLTNGTVMPQAPLLDALRDTGTAVFISNYPVTATKAAQLRVALERHRIGYEWMDVFEWNDLGGFEKRNRRIGELTSLYAECGQRNEWSLVAGRLSCCGRASSAEKIGLVVQPDDEVVDLSADFDAESIRERIRHMVQAKRCFSVCDHCNGQLQNGLKIKPAIQISRKSL